MPDNLVYEEKELLLRVAGGDEAAFRKLFDQYWNNIYSVALVYTKSAVLAEEVVQDVFLKIWLKKECLAGVEKLECYLFVVARNHIYNVLKTQIREQAFTDDLLEHCREGIYLPEQQMIFKEAAQLIDEAAGQLPEQKKKIFFLSRKDGLSHEEIARVMGISKFTVKTHMHLALKQIRSYIEKHSDLALYMLCIMDLSKKL